MSVSHSAVNFGVFRPTYQGKKAVSISNLRLCHCGLSRLFPQGSYVGESVFPFPLATHFKLLNTLDILSTFIALVTIIIDVHGKEIGKRQFVIEV